jgi:dihydrofolate reductase
MNKLILQMQMSVDGCMSSDTDIPWQVWDFSDRWTWDERLQRQFNAGFDTIGCILLSRKMAEEGYLDHWRRIASDHADDPRYAFARKIGQVRKVVLTDKLRASRWEGTELARGGLAEEVNALKREGGGDVICFGGVGFASALVAAGLVDEYQLFVNPAAVGAGRSIFAAQPDGMQLRLLQSTGYDCGVVVNRYAPADVGAA